LSKPVDLTPLGDATMEYRFCPLCASTLNTRLEVHGEHTYLSCPRLDFDDYYILPGHLYS
jgi:hypothetical protein